MKVFDFTNGVKGELLGEARRPQYMSGCLVKKGNKVFRVELSKGRTKTGEWTWHTEAGRGFAGTPGHSVIRPEDFGVAAIWFSTGQWNHNDMWNWVVVGTEDWNRKAVKAGILKFSVERIVDEVEDQAQAA